MKWLPVGEGRGRTRRGRASRGTNYEVERIRQKNVMFKLDLEKAEEQEIKLPTSPDHQKSQRVPEKHLFLLH